MSVFGLFCKTRHLLIYLKLISTHTITVSFAVTLDPNWPLIYTGETVTVRCEIQDRGPTKWTYEWRPTNGVTSPEPNEIRIIGATRSHSGNYRCRGKTDSHSSTEWSNVVTLTVSDKPRATLTPGPTNIPVGGSVTLSCSVDVSDGWKYDWFRRTSYYDYENQITTAGEGDRIIRVSQGGIYRCRGRRGRPDFYTDISSDVSIKITFSNSVSVTLQHNWPQMFSGETITLRCEIQDGGDTGWEYEWRQSRSTTHRTNRKSWTFRVSSSGDYMCKGTKTQDSSASTEWSQPTTLTVTPAEPKAQIRADSSDIPVGGSVTLSCSVNPSSGWTYHWYRGDRLFEPLTQDAVSHTNGRISVSQGGIYWCRGGRGNPVYYTQNSQTVRIDKISEPVLSVSPSWLSPGASVTLNCELEHPSAGWRFYWYKAVPDLSHKSYRYELLPARDTGTGHNSYVLHGQTHTAGHVCRAGRGDPVYYTDHSEPQFVWSGDVGPSASLTVNPDRVQHFTSDSVSLSCEGNSTEWTVRRFPEDVPLSPCSHWGTMTGSTCNFFTSQSGSAVYWCESGSGEFSNSVNITVHNADILLVSPVHPVTEGQSVTVGCKFRNTNFVSNVIFYQNDKVRQNDTRQELNISAVSKSDEGFYKCQCSGKESPQSWLTVTGPTRSSPPVALITGLVCGIIFIILLLLLFRYKWSKGETSSKDLFYVGGKRHEDMNLHEGSLLLHWRTMLCNLDVSSSHRGEYRCKGRMKTAQQSSTDWSDTSGLTKKTDLNSQKNSPRGRLRQETVQIWQETGSSGRWRH
ncbi:hypothetical protein Q5P01_000352 [Channa striata]|uniref:Ig-like domain-containing protein n=1 Tax=Channa striata TaxID=64152 RepID=A0AA88LE85_CHASR|nr:hypothetical protein Q5P01_000352 [Channa striata]